MASPKISIFTISIHAAYLVKYKKVARERFDYVVNTTNLPRKPKNIIKVGSDKGCLNLIKCPLISTFFNTIYTLAYENREKIYFISLANGDEYFMCSDFMYSEIAPLCEVN